jgi:formylglycine-generating enzyme required for sulfatase activity
MTAMTRRDSVGAAYAWVPPGAGLAGCWMMRTPVTNALWRAAVAASVIGPPEDARAYDDPAQAQHPVVFVTRDMARAYARWVGGRLPRDAEWTRAAQGDDGRTYPWGEQPPDATRANCVPHGPGGTTPVGSYPAGASPYGLLDMAGNVWEWVEADDGSHVLPIIRGGAFRSTEGAMVCDAWGVIDDDGGFSLVGFRVAASDP